MRDDTTTVPSLVAIADDLVDLARADHDTYRRRAESARRCVNLTGAPEVLADLRRRLDDALDHLDPATGAVALASLIGDITR
ncbi:hypothetical protein QBL07_017960 [Gordonia rubripertincta]|uniref:DUF222 domain-containing protein n=1 Tax=Gordonia rubripertincta TaxID=36822 RepID=A0AAW6R8I0_GORRU|nr:hypothetical protein [Gordonia rubripertincta]MDG6779584.1 hypothetical protein [Gordonia rubripertincta]NKY62890.1 hypothetical protein [Gordonia rubripertincta]